MRFEHGQRVDVDREPGRVVDHNPNEPHLVVVRFDDGRIHKVAMHRVRILENDWRERSPRK